MTFDTIEVPKKAFLHNVFELAYESDDWQIHLEESAREDFMEKFHPDSVTDVEAYEDYVVVHGELTVSEFIRRIPASGGGKLSPPTNPPEVVTEEHDVIYTIEHHFDGLGHSTVEADVY